MVLARFHPAQPLAGSWCLLSACRLPLQETCPSQNGLSPELGLVLCCSLTKPSMRNLLFEDTVPRAECLVLSMLSPCSLAPIWLTEVACTRQQHEEKSSRSSARLSASLPGPRSTNPSVSDFWCAIRECCGWECPRGPGIR